MITITDEQLTDLLSDCEDEAAGDCGGTAPLYARDAVAVLAELQRLRAFEASVREAHDNGRRTEAGRLPITEGRETLNAIGAAIHALDTARKGDAKGGA